jgi:hypothetical protein
MDKQTKERLKELKKQLQAQMNILVNFAKYELLEESQLKPMFAVIEKAQKFMSSVLVEKELDYNLFLAASCEINNCRPYIGKNIPAGNTQRMQTHQSLKKVSQYLIGASRGR